MQRHLHPSKEQVRAYMHLRKADRRPPPPPEEIRRQLGWHLSPPASFACSTFPAPADSLQLPGALAQLATLMAVEWCSLIAGASRPR